MKKVLRLSAMSIFCLFSSGLCFSAQAEGLLTGDTKLACEAMTCLSSGQRPDECSPSIRKFFSITASKPWKTIEARTNFLKMCPATNASSHMQSLAEAIANGAGRCDVASINNASTTYTYDEYGVQRPIISDQMPNYCSAYFNHEYTDLKNNNASYPRYVGTSDKGGSWVDSKDYDTALAAYNEAHTSVSVVDNQDNGSTN